MKVETTSKLFSIRSLISSFNTGVTSTPIKFICCCNFDILFSISVHFLCYSFSAKLTRLGFVLLNGAFSIAGVFVISFILIYLSFDFSNFLHESHLLHALKSILQSEDQFTVFAGTEDEIGSYKMISHGIECPFTDVFPTLSLTPSHS